MGCVVELVVSCGDGVCCVDYSLCFLGVVLCGGCFNAVLYCCLV